MKRILDHNPDTGITEIFHGSDDGKSYSIEYRQDVEGILELNKQKQSMGRDYYAQDPDMWRVASIPITVQMKWLTEYGVDALNEDHWPKVKRLLNDPEWRYLKTAEIII